MTYLISGSADVAAIEKSYIKMQNIFTDPEHPYDNIMVSISGGADSDILLDLVQRVRKKLDLPCTFHYVFFETGLEYKATRQHLKYLEEAYGITIQRVRAYKPIPLAVRDHGQPFLSKYVSGMIHRLQLHNFDWSDGSFEELNERFPNCACALKWWTNTQGTSGKTTQYDIKRYPYLKEFMMLNPPDFEISSECCHYAKKLTASHYKAANEIDLSVTGLRKNEGGIRAAAYSKNKEIVDGEVEDCFSAPTDTNPIAEYRPIFKYDDYDKRVYNYHFNLQHSDCYAVYGLKRTGCAGCPFGLHFEEELLVMQEYEPNLYKAVNSIFGKSYDYVRRYRAFAEECKKKGGAKI